MEENLSKTPRTLSCPTSSHVLARNDKLHDISPSSKLDPSVGQINENKIKENNKKIYISITSHKNSLQITKNLSLPGLTNQANIESLRKQSIDQNLLTAQSSRTQDNTRKFSIKKLDSGAQTARSQAVKTSKEEFRKTTTQMTDMYNFFSQPSSRLNSPSRVQTSLNSPQKISPYLAIIEKRMRARFKLDEDKIQCQSRIAAKRHPSYITDGLSNTGKVKYENSHESTSFLSEATIALSPRKPLMNIDSVTPSMVRQKSIFGVSSQHHLEIQKQNIEEEHPLEPPQTKTQTQELKETEKAEVYKIETEMSEMNTPSQNKNPKLIEHFSSHFYTGQQGRINTAYYLIKKPSRLQRTSTISGPETFVVPKIGPFSPFSTQKTKEIKEEDQETSKEYDFLAILKKECPSIFNSLSGGRQDVKVLSSWVQEKISKLLESDLEDKEKCLKCDEIYNLCLNELIRQVSVECLERGELLHKIWSSYYQVLLDFKSHIAADAESFKATYFQKLKQKSEQFKNKFAEKNKENEKLQREKIQYQEEISQWQEKYNTLLSKEIKFRNRIDHYKKMISFLKNHVEDLRQENFFYSKQLDKSPNRNDNKEADHAKYKTRNSEQSPEDHSSIPSNFRNRNTEAERRKSREGRLTFGSSKIRLQLESMKNNTSSTPRSNKNDKEKQIQNTINSDISTESEQEFEFLDIKTNTVQKYTFNQLNTHIITNKVHGLETSVAMRVFEAEKEEREVQTHITLMMKKYDEVFENQLVLDDLMIDRNLKKEVDNFAENADNLLMEIEAEKKNLEEKLAGTRTQLDKEKINVKDIDLKKPGEVQTTESLTDLSKKTTDIGSQSKLEKFETLIKKAKASKNAASSHLRRCFTIADNLESYEVGPGIEMIMAQNNEENQEASNQTEIKADDPTANKQNSVNFGDIFLEKTRLIQFAKIYKIEREKTKQLQGTIEDQKRTIEEMESKIKELSLNQEKCIHNVCPICGDENDDGDEDNQQININDEEDNEKKGDLERKEGLISEMSEEEDDSTISPKKGKKDMRQKKKQHKDPTLGMNIEFNKKKQKEQKSNPAQAIIASIKGSGMKKFKNFMALKSVLKHIYILYSERSKENMVLKDEEFPNFVYTWFLNNFGFKKLAEQKFIIFVLSIKKYLHIVRVNLFARFMGLLEGSANHNLDEINRYFEALEYVNKSKLGAPIQNIETDNKYYIPYLRAVDYVKYFAESKMPFDEYCEFRKVTETIKEVDPKGANRSGIIDFDLLMTKVLTKYRVVCYRTKENVVSAFKAADLDVNKNCSLEEFIILYRNIEPDKYDFSFAENLFNEHADVLVDGTMNLSFDKFTAVCVDYGLFSDAQQDQFLLVQTKEDIVKKMQDLKTKWDEYYEEIQNILDSLSKAPREEIIYWQNVGKSLAKRVVAIEDLASQEAKPTLIAFKILVQEVEKLKEKDIEVDVYGIKASERRNSRVLQAALKIGMDSIILNDHVLQEEKSQKAE